MYITPSPEPHVGHFIQSSLIPDEMGALYIRMFYFLSLNYLRDSLTHGNKRSAVNLAYVIHGKISEGETPIFELHGLLGSKRNWKSMSNKIASTMQKCVIAVDARNHGESPHDSSHTYHDLASDIVLLMNKLSVKQADIIGHSMGGRTAMVLALSEPSKVSSLVVVDISPVSTAGVLNAFFPKLLEFMKTIKLYTYKNAFQARADVKKKLIASGVDKDTSNFIVMNIGTKSNNSIGWNCNLDALDQNFNYIATFPSEMTGKQYVGPTLFIGGEQSNYIPPSDIDGIRKFFPKAELKYVSGVGHNVHAENPTAFFSLVKQFLSK
ncbi:sn-1-specific diacylglycerol lipase ABHD11-like [Aphomia sociella]